jgi:hypothetical protein
MIPPIAAAGPIARQYSLGFDGVSWGDSVAEVMDKHPGGEHFFATRSGAHREYSVPNDRPLFGLSRTNMRDYYFFDDTDSVQSVSVSFPYEERESLLIMLTLTFGPVRSTATKGIETVYYWKSDDGTAIALRQTSHSPNGILTLAIVGPNSALSRNDSECTTKSAPQSPKR